jgi:hypothetical protein
MKSRGKIGEMLSLSAKREIAESAERDLPGFLL